MLIKKSLLDLFKKKYFSYRHCKCLLYVQSQFCKNTFYLRVIDFCIYFSHNIKLHIIKNISDITFLEKHTLLLSWIFFQAIETPFCKFQSS